MVATVVTATLAALAALAWCAAAGAHTHTHRRHAAGKIQIDPSSELLARSLRRQLMEDNYDYMTTGSVEGRQGYTERGTTDTATPHGEGSNEGKELEEKVAVNLKGSRRSYSSQKSLYGNKDKARRKYSRKLARRRKRLKKYKSIVSKDMAQRYRSRYRYKPGNGDASVADEPGGPGGPATLVHYRVLQVNNGHRRSGQDAALIQEESPRGVALVKLDGGPFPEFRLPTDDLAPPMDPVDTVTVDNTHASHNEGENSLKITVTPDEILVV